MSFLITKLKLKFVGIFSVGVFFGCASAVNETTSHKAVFDCERLGQVNVIFDSKQETARVFLRGDIIVLPQQPAASGFYYSNGKISIRGKGQALTIEIGRMAPIQCGNFK